MAEHEHNHGPTLHQADAAAIIEAVERLSEARHIGDQGSDTLGRIALAVLPSGKKIEDLKPYLDKLRTQPERIETVARATQVQSLIDYLNRFKLADSAVFADDNPAKPSLFGVVDFHGGEDGVSEAGGDSTPGSFATPRFGRHCVRYDFPLSEQWTAWAGISGRGLSHVEMAEFLNDRQYDIANPPLDWMMVDAQTTQLILHLLNIHDDGGDIDDDRPDTEPYPDGEDRYIPRSALYKLRRIRFGSAARLLQMARTVEIAADAKTVEGYDPKTGVRTVQFEENHEARSKGYKIQVPDGFLLKIPVFEGETPQLVPVRLQYRRGQGGGVKWLMDLVQHQRAVRFAVKTEANRVQKATGLALFYGARSGGAA